MKYKTLSLVLLIFLNLSCKKIVSLTGPVQFEGKVTDKVTGQPIPNMNVQLVPYKAYYFSGIWSEEEYNNFRYVLPVTTDTNGRYSIAYEADGGQSSFAVFVNPDYRVNNRLYVPASNVDRYKHPYKLGNHTVDFECFRSAIVKVNLINIPPFDTANISISGWYDMMELNRINRDTTVYMVIKGNPSDKNYIDFFKNRNVKETQLVNANNWDTVAINYNY